jgi:hypothetical protein
VSEPERIHIDDLAAPRQTEAALAAIAKIEQVPFELTSEAIVAAARAECDAPLYEEPALIERLDEYVEAIRADRDFTRLGRFDKYNNLKRQLIQRSRLEALYLAHPEIDEIEIERPLIIAGLPRSGTTHLLNLLGADPRLRALPRWEAYQPIPSLAAQRGEAPDDRMAAGQAGRSRTDLLLPYIKNMYDVPNNGIHEEIELQNLCFSSIMMAVDINVSDWTRRYFARDQRPHYAFLKRILKALQFLSPGERWVMKSPQHLAFLPALYETFPDATFVITHRDPVAVLASWVTMYVYSARLTREPVRVDECRDHAILVQQSFLEGAARDYASLPPDQVEHVYFHEFMADDAGTLDRIYARAGFVQPPETRAAQARYLEEHPRGRHGRLVYDLEGDFGLAREQADAIFADYLKTFPVEREEPDA